MLYKNGRVVIPGNVEEGIVAVERMTRATALHYHTSAEYSNILNHQEDDDARV
jgi:hypothetical protein